MSSRLGLAMVVAIVIGSACNADVDYAGTAFQCEQTSECPDGRSCVTGYCIEPGGCPMGWWDCAYRRRIEINFAHQGPAVDDLPVPLVLDATRIDYTQARDRGQDVRVVDPAGMVLAHEIERWDPLGTSVVWILVPQLDTSTERVWLYYGNATASDGQDSATLWADFRAVWHLDGDPGGPGPQAVDSTANANHGISQGTMTSDDSVAGQVGRAVELDGVDDFVRIPSSPSLDVTTSTVTLSAWVRLSGDQPSDGGVIVKSSTVSDEDYNYQLGVQATDRVNFRVRTAVGPTGLTYLNGATILQVGRWYYLSGVYDGTTARVYLDAVEDGTDLRTGTILATTEPVVLGRRAIGDDRFFVGAIDEARIATVARSPAWLAADLRAVTGALVTYAAEDVLP